MTLSQNPHFDPLCIVCFIAHLFGQWHNRWTKKIRNTFFSSNIINQNLISPHYISYILCTKEMKFLEPKGGKMNGNVFFTFQKHHLIVTLVKYGYIRSLCNGVRQNGQLVRYLTPPPQIKHVSVDEANILQIPPLPMVTTSTMQGKFTTTITWELQI